MKCVYALFIFIIFLVGVFLPASASMRMHGKPSVTTFAHLNVGGGGFTSGIQAASDGTIVSRVDVFGTYLYNTVTTTWTLLDTETIMPAGANPQGGIEIVVCDSNTNVIYKWMGDGNVYRSTNKGTSFVQLTGFGTHNGSNTSNGGNGGDPSGLFSFAGRLNGYKMACDPANPDVLYVGRNDGVVVSTNASQGSGSTPTFSATTGITAADLGGAGYNFAFDASSGTTGGKTNILYVSSEGHGIFKMTTPGGSFSSVTSAPTSVKNMSASPNGLLWVADGTSGYKCTSCSTSPSWTTYTSGTTGVSPVSVVIDPNHSSSSSTEHVIFVDAVGKISPTSNSGTSWTATGLTYGRISSLIPWLANTPEQNLNTSLITYDKTTDLIWLGEGIGVWTVAGNTTANYNWTAATAGIESLVTTAVVSCPNATSQPSMSSWDRALWGISAIGTYPTNHGSTYEVAIGHGWNLDCAGADSGDGTTLVGYENSGNIIPTGAGGDGHLIASELMGISNDFGVTWSPLPINTNYVTATRTTSGSAAAGTFVLNLSSALPSWVGREVTVTNTTHAGTVNSLATVNSTTQLQLDPLHPVTGVGVSSGDTLKFGFSTSGLAQVYSTTSATTSGAVLHFTSLSANVHPGMTVVDLSNQAAINMNGNGTSVLSISGSDVTLTSSVLSTVASGDAIQFTDPMIGGSIAVSTALNYCVTPSNDGPYPSCTTDGGATWNVVSISGVPRTLSGSTSNGSTTVTVTDTSNLITGSVAVICDNCGPAVNGAGCIPANATVSSITDATHIVISAAATCTATSDLFNFEPGWNHANYNNVKNIAADRVTANKFYAYNYITGKVYASTNGGVSWSNVLVSPSSLRSVGGTGGYGQYLKAVPSNAGHLFFTGGNIQFQDPQFERSTDGGANWSAVTGVTSVQAMGFGKPKPGGGGYPTIFIVGKLNGGAVHAYRSDDNCATWIDLGTNPDGSLAGTNDLDGDKNVYGKVYGAGGSNGWWYGALNFLLKRDLDPAANDNVPMFLNRAA